MIVCGVVWVYMRVVVGLKGEGDSERGLARGVSGDGKGHSMSICIWGWGREDEGGSLLPIHIIPVPRCLWLTV